MFNDLQNPNNQRPPVDDIFAETDKASEKANMPTSEIETHRAGLVSAAENETIVEESAADKKGGGKWFKIVIILIVAVIIILAGYLVYDKFLKTSEPVDLTVNTKTTDTTVKTTPDTVVVPLEEEPAFMATETPDTTVIPDIPGVNAPVDTATNTEITPIVIPPVDSDGDSLTDDEEKLAGTNINIIDTDTDGLSDYEEIKIYKTNPLNADTDADGYLDGAEVANGYNPNGPGKLPGLTPVNP